MLFVANVNLLRTTNTRMIIYQNLFLTLTEFSYGIIMSKLKALKGKKFRVKNHLMYNTQAEILT